MNERSRFGLATGSQQEFEAAWSKVPKDLQVDARLLRYYLDCFIRKRWGGAAAEQTLLRSLDQHWDDRLIEVYGRFPAGASVACRP